MRGRQPLVDWLMSLFGRFDPTRTSGPAILAGTPVGQLLQGLAGNG